MTKELHFDDTGAELWEKPTAFPQAGYLVPAATVAVLEQKAARL